MAEWCGLVIHDAMKPVLLLSIGGTIFGEVLAELDLAILDRCLTNHSYPSLSRMYIGPADLALSISDVTLLVTMLFPDCLLRMPAKPG